MSKCTNMRSYKVTVFDKITPFTCTRWQTLKFRPNVCVNLHLSCKDRKNLTFSLIFEEFFCAKLEDVVQFLFGHGTSFGSQAWPHHQVGQHHLPLSHLRDALLHAGACHKAVDHHLVGLADPMGSTKCLVSDGKKPLGSGHNEKHLMAASRWYLNVVVRVPVGVKDDDCVCCGQVDAKTSSSSGEQETKLTGTRS